MEDVLNVRALRSLAGTNQTFQILKSISIMTSWLEFTLHDFFTQKKWFAVWRSQRKMQKVKVNADFG